MREALWPTKEYRDARPKPEQTAVDFPSSEFRPLASELDEVVLQVAEGASIEGNTRLVAGVLKDLHGGLEDFTVVVPEQLLAQSKSRTFALTGGAVQRTGFSS